MSWTQSAFASKISPVILFIIVILAAVFFVASLLHLLIRFLLKKRSAYPRHRPEMPTSGALRRQLQQLFHLHDSGLDQSHIDALPVFLYQDIIMGSKEPFDCAVCLCEFSEQDELRLLPLCSHAFHIDCIGTWLMSNSTCPLCRGAILSPGISFENPVFWSDNSRDIEDDENCSAVVNERRVFSVRLGKFRSSNNGGNQENEAGETSNGGLDCRRCYSMGSFQYVVADSELQIALFPSTRERRGQNGNFTGGGGGGGGDDGKKISNRAKGESFSVSNIWLWSKKGNFASSTAAHCSNVAA